MKNETGADAKPQTIKQVGVLGGGLMGGGIAYVSAVLGKYPVRIKDISDKGIAQALRYSWDLLSQRVSKGAYSLGSGMQLWLGSRGH